MIGLGDKVLDRVSGLKGIVVSEIKYISGCHQFGVQAPFQDGKMPQTEYIDTKQLHLVTKAKDIIIDEDEPGGEQSFAPKK